MIVRTPLVLAAALALPLLACGGDDEPVPAPAAEPTAEPAADAADRPAVDGPVSTLSPDIPEAFEGGVAPVDVIGDSLPPLENESDDPAVGQQVPVLVGIELDGQPIRIDPATDGATMVVFLAHWCPHCNDEVPKLNDMRDAGQFPDALDIVAVNTAVSRDRPNWPPDEWLADTMEWTYPAMYDGIDMERQTFIAADAYGVTGFPFVALVNADGTVAARWSGERETGEILAAISELDLG